MDEQAVMAVGPENAMERGYVDYARLYAVHKQGAFCVIRANDNLKFKRLYSVPKDKEAGILRWPIRLSPW